MRIIPTLLLFILSCGVCVAEGGSGVKTLDIAVDRVSLKVLDYYGGSATGINEYDGAYGAGRLLKSGDTVSGEVKLWLIPPGR